MKFVACVHSVWAGQRAAVRRILRPRVSHARGIVTFLFGLAFIALASTGHAQKTGNWRVFRAGDGLPESASASVNLGSQGKVLVTHVNPAAISELDGYDVKVFPAPAAGGRVYQSPGGQLWAVAPGGLQELKEGAWILHPVPDIEAFLRENAGTAPSAIQLCPIRQGLVLYLLPDGLMQYDGNNPEGHQTTLLRSSDRTRIGKFLGMTPARDGGLWVSGEAGVARIPGPLRALVANAEWRETLAPASVSARHFEEPRDDGDDGVTFVATFSSPTEKACIHFDGREWKQRRGGGVEFQRAWLGPDRTLWGASIDNLLEFDPARDAWTEPEDISARKYLDATVERGRAFWLATADGLYRYAQPLWQVPAPARGVTAVSHCVAEDADGRIWFVANGGLHSISNEVHQEYAFPKADGAVLGSTHRVFPLKDGTLLLDAGEQSFEFRPATGAFARLGPPVRQRRIRPLGFLEPGKLCLQIIAPDEGDSNDLQTYDGSEFRDFAGLPSKDSAARLFSTLFVAANGDVWLAAPDGVWCSHEQKWRAFAAADKTAPESAEYFAETPDGKIWCATPDKVWSFDGRDWTLAQAGFNRITDLARTRDGSLWVASGSGLFRFTQGAWVENGTEEGLPAAGVRALCEDRQGHFWAATARGLSVFHPEADLDAPRATIDAHTDQAGSIPEGGSITLTFGARDKWKYTPPNRLMFSYQLDGRDWSAFGDVNGVSFSDLASGKHFFRVRAMDRNANISSPAQIDFAVALPWYRETRLLMISIAGAVLALFFAALAFNRHRQLLRSHALVEKKVAERTRELEIAHRELLHSQKMNALGTLAAGIAHDFNNILSIIKGSAQMIEDNAGNPEKIRTRVERIKTVVRARERNSKGHARLQPRIGSATTGPCDVNAVVDDTVKLLGRPVPARSSRSAFEPAGDLPPVRAARDFIQQILINFIFNAAEAMSGRKHVVLATRRRNSRRRVSCCRRRRPGSTSLFRCGISAAASRRKSCHESSSLFSPPKRYRPGAAQGSDFRWSTNLRKKWGRHRRRIGRGAGQHVYFAACGHGNPERARRNQPGKRPRESTR